MHLVIALGGREFELLRLLIARLLLCLRARHRLVEQVTAEAVGAALLGRQRLVQLTALLVARVDRYALFVEFGSLDAGACIALECLAIALSDLLLPHLSDLLLLVLEVLLLVGVRQVLLDLALPLVLNAVVTPRGPRRH